jgi:hypothetical protein
MRKHSVIAATVLTLSMALAACGNGTDQPDEAFTPGDATPPAGTAPSPSASATRPAFAFPPYFRLTFDYPATGDPKKDAVLADLRTFWEAWYYAAGDPRAKRDQWKAYTTGNAAIFFSKPLETFRKNNSGTQGEISFYRVHFTRLSGDEAIVVQCKDLRRYFGRNLSTGKRIGSSSPEDYLQEALTLAPGGHGVWQVRSYSFKRGVAACKP